ncbi:MAG: N utilization substance protein B, partial [Candidatus Regiella insecticola]|nr:N utilization substance protein B [Candidatus Regiella insecticola]
KNNIADIQSYFLSEQDMKEVDINYFGQLLSGVAVDTATLDRLMAPYLSRQIEDLGQIEKAILRLAVFELSQRDDIPYKVVIDEAIELA